MELESDSIWQQEVVAQKNQPAEKLAASGRQQEEARSFLAAVKPVRGKRSLHFGVLQIITTSVHPHII